MEKVKNNLSNTVKNLSQIPLKNMIIDKATSYSNEDLTGSRMKFIKSFAFWFIIIIILSLYGLNIFLMLYLVHNTLTNAFQIDKVFSILLLYLVTCSLKIVAFLY